MSKKYDLLVVEDEPVVLAAIRKIIESENINMDDVRNGENAIRKLKENTYKLLITDLMLPRISGLDLIRIIKGNQICIPIVVITGYATLEKALQSFKVGSFDFIPKPFDTEVFLGVIRRGLNFSQLMQSKADDRSNFMQLSDASGVNGSAGKSYCLGYHAWIKFEEENTALIGVGATFPNMMGELCHIENLASGGEVLQGKCCAKIFTKDGLVNMIWSPLSGKIESYNEDLDKNLQLINSDPYDQGWIFRVIPSNFKDEVKYLTRCKIK